MKLEMKKIALIMAAGIFAFSGAFALGEDTTAKTPMTNEQAVETAEVDLVNATSADKVDLTLNTDDEKSEKIELKRGQRQGNKKGFRGGHGLKSIVLKIDGTDSGEIYILKKGNREQRLADLRTKLKEKFPKANIDVKMERGKLTIDIKSNQADKDVTTNPVK